MVHQESLLIGGKSTHVEQEMTPLAPGLVEAPEVGRALDQHKQFVPLYEIRCNMHKETPVHRRRIEGVTFIMRLKKCIATKTRAYKPATKTLQAKGHFNHQNIMQLVCIKSNADATLEILDWPLPFSNITFKFLVSIIFTT